MWGVSYLNYHWAEYFFAGKFIYFVSPLISDPRLAARFFNVSLLVVLAILFLYRSKKDNIEFIIPCFLLVTPQIWYVFSYSNNDAFALFVSVLVAYQLAYPASFLREFLQTKTLVSKAGGGILFGGLIGLLSVSKPNYWVFLLFASLWLLITFPLNALALKKYAFMVLIASSVFAFRIGLDFYVNGETNFAGASYINYFFGGFEAKQGKLLAYQNEIANPEFKSSTIENDLSRTSPGILLKAKGTSAAEMLSKWRWHTFSFESFVGGYGYMDQWASQWYYNAMFLLYSLAGLYVASRLSFSKDRTALKQLAVLCACCLLSIVFSFYLSWNYAFQPQGRYLFPVIPMVALVAFSNRKQLHNLALNVFIITSCIFSFYSFVFVGILMINGE